MKRKILYLIAIQLILFSCQNNILDKTEPLNSTGEQFMDLISTYENWRSDFDKMEKIGIPRPNETRLICNISRGGYGIMPITRDKEIVGIALYPINVTNKTNLTTASPDIITEKNAKNNEIIQSLLNTDLFNSWLEKGYLIKFEKDDRANKDPHLLSRFNGTPRHQHVFCFELWWYVPDQYYLEVWYQTREIVDMFRVTLEREGAEVRFNNEHCCVIFNSDEFSWDEASSTYHLVVQFLPSDIQSVVYVNNVNFYEIWEFQWRDEYAGGSGGNTPDSPSDTQIVDPTGLEENPYINCIYKKLATKSSTFQSYINRFMGDNSIAHLKFEYGESMGAYVNGKFELNMQNYWLTIKLNEIRLMNSTPLMVAKTIMHEVIHANIFAKLMSLKPRLQANLSAKEMTDLNEALNNQNFPTLNYYYEKYVYDATSQHQYMAQYNVDVIAAALQDIDPSASKELRTAIAWEGLKQTKDGSGNFIETEAWKALPEVEKQKLAKAYSDYLTTATIECNN